MTQRTRRRRRWRNDRGALTLSYVAILPFVFLFIMVLIQAMNHAIDHCSQIATLLSQQDIEPPRLDGWGYDNAMLSPHT